MRGREYYLNLDFDVSLQAGGGEERRAQAADIARDLAPAFLLAAGPGDRLLLEDAVPAAFLEYLRAKGFEPAAVGDVRAPDPTREFVPYGWNEAAAALARRYEGGGPAYPELDIVRRVNSREYSAAIERERFGADHGLGLVRTLDELEELLADASLARATAPVPSVVPAFGGFVVKANHSNASLGNRRVRGAALTAEDRGVIGRLLREAGSVAVERWHERFLDLVVTMRVEPNGDASELHVHEIVNTAEGSFLGALFGAPAAEFLFGITGELEEAGRAVAAQLAADGYFGPACFDAYTWRDGAHIRLRPLVDLNARLGMSQPFREVSRRLGDDRVCYGRFFASRRFPFGGDQRELEARLGRGNFDPADRRGVLLASPLRLGSGAHERVARRFAVVFVGDTRDEVLDLDDAFRRDFDRQAPVRSDAGRAAAGRRASGPRETDGPAAAGEAGEGRGGGR